MMCFFYACEIMSAFLVFLIVFVMVRGAWNRREIRVSVSACAVMIAFSAYVIGVYHFTGAGTLYDGLNYSLEIRREQLNIIPFSRDIDVAAYGLNVLLFVPFGVFVPMIWKQMDGKWHVFGTSLLFSMLIEGSQLLNNRRTDIDDLIMNTVGAVIGYVLYTVWDKFTKSKYQLSGFAAVELPVYILILFAGRFLLFNEMGLAGLLYGF